MSHARNQWAARLEETWPKALVYLFLAALAIRVLYLQQYSGSSFFWAPALDSLYHDVHARALAAGQDEPGAYFRAPLYTWFLAGLYRMFGHSFWAVRLCQAMIGAGSCVLLASLGRRVFDAPVGLLAGTLLAFYGPEVFFEGELHTPVLEVFLTLGFLALAVRADESGRATEWAATGFVVGLAALARPNALVALPLLLVITLIGKPTGQGADGSGAGARRLLAAASVALGALLPPAGVTLRNWLVAHDRVFIASQGGINLYLGNRPEADGFTPTTPKQYSYAGEYEDSVALYGQKAAEEQVGRPLPASEAQAHWVRKAVTWWRTHPGEALRLLGKKIVLAFTHREIRNNHAFDFVRRELAPLLWLCPIGFWFAGTFGLVGMALAWHAHPRSRLLMGFVVCYTASFVLFFVADRFRLPVAPVLLLFAAFAAARLAELIGASAQAPYRRPAAAYATGLAAAALFVGVDWFPTTTPAREALDYWSAGNRARQLGRGPEAERWYRAALQRDPRNPEFWLNLGAVEYEQGNPGAAAASFRQVLALDPSHAGACYNLAVCALEQRRPAEARPWLEQAVRLDPAHAGARRELAALSATAPRR